MRVRYSYVTVLASPYHGALPDALHCIVTRGESREMQVYQRYALPYGCKLTQDQILQNFRRLVSGVEDRHLRP